MVVDENTYEISALTGTYDDLDATLTSQVWWGDSQLAKTCAEALGGDLGYPNTGGATPAGPLFSFELHIYPQGQTRPTSWTWFGGSANLVTSDPDALYTYATAEKVSSQVPLPASLPLLVGAETALCALRRRR